MLGSILVELDRIDEGVRTLRQALEVANSASHAYARTEALLALAQAEPDGGHAEEALLLATERGFRLLRDRAAALADPTRTEDCRSGRKL